MPGVFDTEYVFPTGQNNGEISASIDHISGQQVNYTYDSLKRLSTAGTSAAGWGQAYTYDGFGNLTAATVTQGSGVNFAQAYDPGTNHAVGNGQFQYDANGNQIFYSTVGYAGENRMTQGNGNSYTYDPSGKRVWMNPIGSASGTLYFYDISGKLITTITVDGTYGVTGAKGNIYFGSRLVVSGGQTVVTDRLGSVRADATGQKYSYLPYGIEQTSTPNSQVKFGTYLRDGNSSTLGADYADQRYYNPWFGRFNTPDPAGPGAAKLGNPISWNMYAYVGGDPVNHTDDHGLIVDEDNLEWADALGSGGFGCAGTLGVWWDCPILPGPGGDGGSGLLGAPRRTQGEIDAATAAALAGLAAVIAAGQSAAQGGNSYPKYLKVTDDYYTCWGTAVERNVSYQLYDSNDNPLPSGTVTEHLFATDYAAPVIALPGHSPDTSSGQANGTFNDEISIQYGYPRSYLQTFTASDPSEGLAGFAGNPVYVVGFGGTYGVLSINKTATEVDINGNKGNPTKCN